MGGGERNKGQRWMDGGRRGEVERGWEVEREVEGRCRQLMGGGAGLSWRKVERVGGIKKCERFRHKQKGR